MSHNDAQLTIAVSRLLQEDLVIAITNKNANWQLVDSGLVPSFNNKPPKSIFFIARKVWQPATADWVRSQQWRGGSFFRIELTIETTIDSAAAGLPVARIAEWSRKYVNTPHVKCVMKSGAAFEMRYSASYVAVCDGIYYLLEAPDCTQHLADKIRIAMNSYMLTQSVIERH